MTQKKSGEPDRSIVNTIEEHEIAYWTKRFGCTKAQLLSAVAVVGNGVARVEDYIKKH
jgi:hypothetical protein